jgi:hypothetical protein
MAVAAAGAAGPAASAMLRGLVKQVLSPDTVVIVRGRPTGGAPPPPERTLSLAHITAPRLGRKDEKDEVCVSLRLCVDSACVSLRLCVDSANVYLRLCVNSVCVCSAADAPGLSSSRGRGRRASGCARSWWAKRWPSVSTTRFPRPAVSLARSSSPARTSRTRCSRRAWCACVRARVASTWCPPSYARGPWLCLTCGGASAAGTT